MPRSQEAECPTPAAATGPDEQSDGFQEANQILANALQQIDVILAGALLGYCCFDL